MSRILTNSDEDEAFIKARGLCEEDAKTVREMRKRLQDQQRDLLRGKRTAEPHSPDKAPKEQD